MRGCAVAALLVTLGTTGCGADAPPVNAVAGDAARVGTSPAPTPEPTASTAPPPGAPGTPQVVQGTWCSDELVDYMVQQSTSSEFKRGFGRPALLDGLDVGCAAVAKQVSFAGYLDTFAFVKRRPGIFPLLHRRILALGYTGLSGPTGGTYDNAAGDPEGFVRILGEAGDTGGSEFAAHTQWVVIQFYLPG
jgi:hypothetical protein